MKLPRASPLAFAALALCACQRSDVKVLIGGTAIVAPGARPIEDSVIIVAGRRIESVGLRRDVPIPQDSERTDVSGKWVVPSQDGRIAVGAPANLLVIDRAPAGITPVSPADIEKRLADGRWQNKP